MSKAASLRRLLHGVGLATWVVDEIVAQVAPPVELDEADEPRYVISAAAKLAGMHPQTLRQYDRLGLVVPSRTSGRGRRYSANDVRRLREIQRLSHEEGINLAGISRIMELERRLERAERELRGLRRVLDHLASMRNRVFAADPSGDVTSYERGRRPAKARPGGALVRYRRTSDALVVWGQDRFYENEM